MKRFAAYCLPTVLALLVVFLQPDDSRAHPLRDAQFYQIFRYPYTEESSRAPGTLSDIVVNDVYSVDAATSISSGPIPSAKVRMAYTVFPDSSVNRNGKASATIDYQWSVEQIDGDSYTGKVPVIINAKGYAHLIDRSSSAGIAQFYTKAEFLENGIDNYREFMVALTDVGKVEFDETYTANVSPNVHCRTILEVNGSLTILGSGSFSFDLWVDPIITIDPSFARINDFQLVFSPGITTVPVPAPLLLLASGLVPLTWLRRLKCRKHVVDAIRTHRN